MEIRIPSHRISFTEEQKVSIGIEIQRVLESGNVVLGEYTQQFEELYAEKVGRKYGVAVSSDTAAFEIQLRTMDWPKDSMIMFPALGFGSILESIHNAGHQPWFIDADLEAHLFAKAHEVEQALIDCHRATGSYPKALILMHTGGLIAAESTAIEKVCLEYGVEVMEDAAHAYGSTLNGRPAGSWGVTSAFSLYATKPMHAMEGGMLLTDIEGIANEAKLYRNYGRESNFGRSVITRHGSSWRMTEIQAIVGISNLKHMEPKLARRQEIMMAYDGLIDAAIEENHEGWCRVRRVPTEVGMVSNGYRYLLLLHKDFAEQEWRAAFKDVMRSGYGIDLPGEVYELPAHMQPVWRGETNGLAGDFPVAEDFCHRHFALPVYETLTDTDAEYVIESVGEALKGV